MPKNIEVVYDHAYLVNLTPALLIKDLGDSFDEINFFYNFQHIGALQQKAPGIVELIFTADEKVPLQIHWDLPADQTMINEIIIKANNYKIFLFGHWFLSQAVNITCHELTLMQDKINNTKSQLDAPSIIVQADHVFIDGILGRDAQDGAVLLKKASFHAANFMSLHGRIYAEEATISINSPQFRSITGRIFATAFEVNAADWIHLGRSTTLCIENITVHSAQLVHEGFIGFHKQQSISHENILEGQKLLIIKGEINAMPQLTVRLVSQGSSKFMQDDLMPNLLRQCPITLQSLLPGTGKRKATRTFIQQAKDDLCVYKDMLAECPTSEDISKNRKELLAILESAITNASEALPQDELCNAYKICLRRLQRHQTLFTYFLPFQSYWRAESRLESILRDTLWQLDHNKLIARFSEHYHDFNAPEVVDTSSQMVQYFSAKILPICIPVLGPLIKVAAVCRYLYHYTYSCYQLLKDQFDNTELIVALPVVSAFCSILSEIGLSSIVDSMLNVTPLVAQNMRQLYQLIQKRKLTTDYVAAFFKWIQEDHKSESFENRLIHLLVLMLLSPLDVFSVTIMRNLEQNTPVFEKSLDVLMAFAEKLLPCLQGLNVIRQSAEYIKGNNIDNLSFRNILCIGITLTVNTSTAQRFAVSQELGLALSRARNITLQTPATTASEETRAKVLAGELFNAMIQRYLAMTFSVKIIPETYFDCHPLIQFFCKEELSDHQQWILTYLISYSLEKIIPVSELKSNLKEFNFAQSLLQMLIDFAAKFTNPKDPPNGFWSTFLDNTTKRPGYMKLFDALVSIAIIQLKISLQNIAGETVEELFHWIHLYFFLAESHLNKLYEFIVKKDNISLNLPVMLQTLENLFKFSSIIFEFTSSSISTLLTRGNTTLTMQSSLFSQKNRSAISSKTPNVDFLLGGKSFQGNIKMDRLRVELLELQCWCNDFFKQDYWGNTSKPFSNFEFATDWELLDSTDFFPTTTQNKIGFLSYHQQTQSSKFYRSKYGCNFSKRNLFDYHGICIRRKHDGLIAICTAGTDSNPFGSLFPNLAADFELMKERYLDTIANFHGEYLDGLYYSAGKDFYDYVKHTYGNPHIFAAHSLGCSFNMLMNGLLRSEVYILNIDAFCGTERQYKHAWEKHAQGFTMHEKNIDSINGSTSFFNKGARHVGSVHSCNTSDGQPISISKPFFSPRLWWKNQKHRHSVHNIFLAYAKSFRIHYQQTTALNATKHY